MTEREIFKKYDNLSENELKAKNNKEVYAKNDVITTAIKCWSGDQKRRLKKSRWIQKKIDDSRI